MGFAFKIERDLIGTEKKGRLYSTTGCKNLPRPCQFKLYDDDGILYYEGTFGNTDGDTGEALGEEAFEPLHWAENEAGCTRIDYFNPKTNTWEIL